MPTNLDFSFDTNDIIEAEHVKQFVDPIQDLESGSAWYRAATGSSNAYVVDFSDEDENGLDAGALTPGQAFGVEFVERWGTIRRLTTH